MSKKQSKAKAYTALLEDEALEDEIDGGTDDDMSGTEEDARPYVPMTPI